LFFPYNGVVNFLAFVFILILRYFILSFFSFSLCYGEGTPLPIPRFVSLRSATVNLHVGPGNHYPVDWQYIRQNMPVEVIAEFDTWRQIRDWQGTEGWVHKSLLSGKRNVWILHKIRKLYNEPLEKSKVIAHVEPGVLAHVLECQGAWCRIEIKTSGQKYRGWIKRHSIWGVYPNETKIS
jgi:SH3-like domain-containing protein